MIDPSIEPLDPATWFERLKKLLIDAHDIEVLSPESLIRQAYHLVKLAPGPFRDLLPVDLDEVAVERMLDCGGFESAVMALIGEQTSFAVHKDAGKSEVSAELSLDPGSTPGSGRHPTCAKAMIQAWVRCLANIAGVEMPAEARNRDRRKSRSGSPPSSTSH